MSRDILNNPVNSGDLRKDNPEPSPSIGKVQRLSHLGVGSSEPKRRRPGKGEWFDGEVCRRCFENDRLHHAKGLCKSCYQEIWYLEHPYSKKDHDHTYYLAHKTGIIRRVQLYYEENREVILRRTQRWYRIRQYNGSMILALDRDNYTCRNIYCPCDTDRLDVHHIDGQGQNSLKPNHSLGNLLTFCAVCHGRVSMGYDIVWSALKNVADYDTTQIVVIVDEHGVSVPC